MLRNGWSVSEALVALVLIGILVSWSAAIAARVVIDAHSAAAAREFAVLFHALRWRSVQENRHVGLFFEAVGDTWRWWEVADGNGNGLRTGEIRDGTDRKTSGPHRIEAAHRGVRLGFPSGRAFPSIPPERGTVSGLDPVRFGRADIVSFGPGGHASSGTLYLTDGRNRLYGIRLYGVGMRVRVWRWDEREVRWRR